LPKFPVIAIIFSEHLRIKRVDGKSFDATQGKPVRASVVEQYHEIFPQDLNPKQTMFGGRVMELIDRIAGIVAHRHSGGICVTLGVDSLRFWNPAKMGETLLIKAAVNRVWTKSMEIGARIMAENFQTGELRHVVSAYLTFVALDENCKPIPILPVIPETGDEGRRYEKAEQRRQLRFQLAELMKKEGSR